MKVLTSPNDDFLYQRLILLLEQVKLVQGADNLIFTLRRHKKIKNYLVQKQSDRINSIENDFFNDDGTLKSDSIQNYLDKHINHVVY